LDEQFVERVILLLITVGAGVILVGRLNYKGPALDKDSHDYADAAIVAI